MRGADYSELAAFLVVTQQRSFRRAAEILGISRSALSHSIRNLEERLGTRLLNRTTRSVSPTEAGQGLFERLAPAFAEIAEAIKTVQATRDQPFGLVRVNLPRLAAEVLLTQRFGEFTRRFPEIRLELAVDDSLADIVSEGFDAGIRTGGLVQRDMVAVPVSKDLRLAVVGSDEYFATRSKPLAPDDLRNHACINYRWSKSNALYRWPLSRGDDKFDVAVEGPLSFNDSGLVVSAALAGGGIACTLEDVVAEHIAAGRLVRVLEDWCPPFPGLFLYYSSGRLVPPALRALIDFLKVRER